jgi:hypothetical protein
MSQKSWETWVRLDLETAATTQLPQGCDEQALAALPELTRLEDC